MPPILIILALILSASSALGDEQKSAELTFEQRKAINEISARGGSLGGRGKNNDELPTTLVLPEGFSDREWPFLEPLFGLPILDLDLRQTKMSSGKIQELLRHLPKLKTVYAGPQFDDDCLAVLHLCPQLYYLDLNENNVSGKPFANAKTFPGLTRLDLTKVSWNAADYQALAKVPKLINLVMNEQAFTAADCQRLAEIPQLQYLFLINCTVAKEGWREFSACKELRHLMPSGTALNDESLSQILGLPKLERIGFDEKCEFSLKGLKSLGTHPKLADIYFYHSEPLEIQMLCDLDQYLNEPRLRANQKKGHLAGMKIAAEQVEKLNLQKPVVLHARNYPPDEDKDHWYPPVWLEEAWDEASEAPLNRSPKYWFPDPPRERRGQAGPPF